MQSIVLRLRAAIVVAAIVGGENRLCGDDVKPNELRRAVTFYASFDEKIQGDFGGGGLMPQTRYNDPQKKGQFVIKPGYPAKAFRIVKKGVSGGALEGVDVLPQRGRLFFPVKGNLAYKPDGWSGSVSVWINTNPDEQLKTPFCDPVQITEKGARNGGIWFDFPNVKPRDLRMGVFRGLGPGEKAVPESDPKAPLVRVKKIGFKSGDWHHVVLTWKSFDTGKPDAEAALFIDGKEIGRLTKRDVAMKWNADHAGIYFAVNYIGLIDELALFNRALTPAEVRQLNRTPGLLSALKRQARNPSDAPRRFSERVDGLRDAPSSDRRIAALRRDLHDYLTTPDRRESLEAVLALLLQLPPPKSTPPAAPKFPFSAKKAGEFQRAYAEWRGLPLEVTNRDGLTFVLVPPGDFVMGSAATEPGHRESPFDETQHPVRLTRPFYLSKRETTVGQFRKFVEQEKYVTDGEKNGGGNAHDAKAVWKHRPGTSWRKPGYAGPFKMRDDHPVVHVSHADCKAFCAWLGRGAKGKTVRYDLPAEAQWEWAARAGSGSRYWWGDDHDATGKVINTGDRTLKRVHPQWPRKIIPMDDGHAFPAPVGSYRANAFGLHDVLGNVWEFCSTRYGKFPSKLAVDPGDLDPKRGFAVRGGGWSNEPKDARSATRNADPPHFCHSNLGFRAALLLEP